MPLLQAIADETCVINPRVPPNNVCFTVTGFGLEPGSEVMVTIAVEGDQVVNFATVGPEGNVGWESAAGCVPGSEEIVLSISASGITATGVPVTTPPDSFSIFCGRG